MIGSKNPGQIWHSSICPRPSMGSARLNQVALIDNSIRKFEHDPHEIRARLGCYFIGKKNQSKFGLTQFSLGLVLLGRFAQIANSNCGTLGAHPTIIPSNKVPLSLPLNKDFLVFHCIWAQALREAPPARGSLLTTPICSTSIHMVKLEPDSDITC